MGIKNGLKEALRKETWGCWLTRCSLWPSNVHSWPRKPNASSAASREPWPANWGMWFCTSALLWRDPTCIQLWGLQHEKDKNLLEWVQRSGTKMVRGLDHISSEIRLRVGIFNLEEKKLLEQPSSTWRRPLRELERGFLLGHSVIGKGSMASNQERVGLD